MVELTPKTPYLQANVLKVSPYGSRTLALFFWKGYGPAEWCGSKKTDFIDGIIEKGVEGSDGRTYKTEDGEKFMMALPHQFNGSHVRATLIKHFPDGHFEWLSEPVTDNEA